MYAEVAKIYSKKESSIHEILKRKKICASVDAPLTYCLKISVAEHFVTMPMSFASLHLLTGAFYHLTSSQEEER